MRSTRPWAGCTMTELEDIMPIARSIQEALELEDVGTPDGILENGP